MKKKSILVSSITLMVFMAVSKGLGFFREMVLAFYYGAGAITDAYVTATTISIAVFSGIPGSIVAAYILVVGERDKTSEEGNRFTSNILNCFALFILSLSILSIVFIRSIVRLFAVGLDARTMAMTVTMASVMLMFSVFFTVSNVMGAYLQYNRVFWYVGVSNILTNIVVIVAIAFSNQNIYVLAFGYGFSILAASLFTFLLARAKRYRYRVVVQLKDTGLKKVVTLSIPIFLGFLLYELNIIVDRNFSSVLGEGVISAVNYASKINLLFHTLIVGSIITVLFPTLSDLCRKSDFQAFKQVAHKAYGAVVFIMIPISLWLLSFSLPLIELVFMRGAFDQRAGVMTSQILRVYSIGLPFMGINQILIHQFYSLLETKTPIKCSMISLSINVILNFCFIRPLGYVGIALATSISAMILMVLLFIRLRKRVQDLQIGSLAINSGLVLLSSLGMLAVIYIMNNAFSSMIGGGFLLLSLSSFAGGIAYLLLTMIFRLPVRLNFIKAKNIDKDQ